MPRRRTDFRGLAEPSRVRLLGAIQKEPGCTLKMLAERTGMALSTARAHARTLEGEGFVTAVAVPSGTRGRPSARYWPVDGEHVSPTAAQRVERARRRHAVLEQHVPRTTRPLDADAARQVDLLYQHLEDTGLDPTVDESHLVVDVVPHRFLRDVLADPELAGSVHARLLRDTLAQVPGPVELDQLCPFFTSETCRIVLKTAGSNPASQSRPSRPGRNKVGERTT